MKKYNTRGCLGFSLQEKLFPYVDYSGDCHVFVGHRQKQGYGKISHKGKTLLAHRVAYELANGPIPENMCVLHRCDNPPCVNPTHLWLGTKRENNNDMAKKGRAAKADRSSMRLRKSTLPRGDHHIGSKISDNDIISLFKEYAQGTTSQVKLARQYKISDSLISAIMKGKARVHLFGEVKNIIGDRRTYGGSKRKLDNEEACNIAHEYQRGEMTQRELSLKYGVSVALIRLAIDHKYTTEQCL